MAEHRDDATTGEESSPPSRRRRVALLLVALLLVGATGGYLTLLRGDGPAAPVPGDVVALEPVQINLAGEHYLRLALALQLTEEVAEVDGSKALDAAISLFSGRRPEALARAETRRTLKARLAAELEEAYDGEVMTVYFTEFVTQ